jgi:hypothetical protein
MTRKSVQRILLSSCLPPTPIRHMPLGQRAKDPDHLPYKKIRVSFPGLISIPYSTSMFGTSPPSQPFNLPATGGHYDTFNPYAQPNPPTTPYGGIGFGLGGHGVGPGMSMLGMPMAGMGGANMGSMSLNGRTMGHLGNLGVFAVAGNAPNVSNGFVY